MVKHPQIHEICWLIAEGYGYISSTLTDLVEILIIYEIHHGFWNERRWKRGRIDGKSNLIFFLVEKGKRRSLVWAMGFQFKAGIFEIVFEIVLEMRWNQVGWFQIFRRVWTHRQVSLTMEIREDMVGFSGLQWVIIGRLMSRYADDYWVSRVIRKDLKVEYIRGRKNQSQFITFSRVSDKICFYYFSVHAFNSSEEMSQGLLVGEAIDKKGQTELMKKKMKISVPHFDKTVLIQSYAITLIGRCFNHDEQDVKSLIIMLPKIWKLEERVAGIDLGHGKFQFDFGNEDDMEEIINNQPYHFDFWMISLARWQPGVEKSNLSDITFWVKVIGVPLQYWAEQTFQSIGDGLGRAIEVDVDYGRVKVVLDGEKEVCFESAIDFCGGEFHDGEEVMVTFKYEKLFGYCKICHKLTHDKKKCPFNTERQNKQDDERKVSSDRLEARASSYKGVLIHGEASPTIRDKVTQEYQGKGKGKMGEEEGARWTKVADRSMRRIYNRRGRYDRAREAVRYRNQRSDGDQRAVYERPANYRSSRGERSLRREERLQVLDNESSNSQHPKKIDAGTEEGEIKDALQNLSPKPAESSKVNKELELVDTGLELPAVMLGESDDLLGSEEMVVDDNRIVDGDAVDPSFSEDIFQDLSEGEKEASNMNEGVGNEETKEVKAGEKENKVDGMKKQGVKKSLFRTGGITGGTTKKRLVQALLSPRKRSVPKGSIRSAERGHQELEKGSSLPSQSDNKP